MIIRIHAEKTSGATDNDKKCLRNAIQRITSRIPDDCTEIVWIIYHPNFREEYDEGNRNQTAVQAAVADIDNRWMDIRKRYGLIDFRKQFRNEYGYCYISDKRIYLSVQSIRLPPTSVSVGNSGDVVKKIMDQHSHFSAANRGLDGTRREVYGELTGKRTEKPGSLQELVLHELAHIISGKGDDDERFWKTLEELKNTMREGSKCYHQN